MTRRGPYTYTAEDQPHHVYRCYDAAGRLLYVGCSVNVKQRIKWHRSMSAHWAAQIATVETQTYPDRPTALRHEREAIGEESPLHNIKGNWKKGTAA